MPDVDEDETRRDQIIEAIFDALPADSYEDIVTKVNRATRLRVTHAQVNNAIAHLRSHSAQYGWTIPHVKRGPGVGMDEGRFVAYLVDRQGHYELDVNPDAGRHLANGMSATIKHTASMMKNASAATRIAATHTRSVNARNRLNDLADDFAYIARRAAAVVRDLEAEAEAA